MALPLRAKPIASTGFSLPELMILVVMSAVVGGVLLVGSGGLLRRQQLRSAAEALASRIEAARQAALQANRPCAIQLSGTVVSRLASAGNCGAVALPPLDLRRVSEQPGLKISHERPDAGRFRFTAGGMLSGATAEQQLVLAAPGEAQALCLNVQRPSGLVRIGTQMAGGRLCSFEDP